MPSNGPSLLTLEDSFQFRVGATAFQKLTEVSKYRWAENTKFKGRNTLQYDGTNLKTIQLDGEIMTMLAKEDGFRAVLELELLAEKKEPLSLTGGDGVYYGLWVIEEIRATNSLYIKEGYPRKIDFTIKLKEYPEDDPENNL